jgi:hypothetical protein
MGSLERRIEALERLYSAGLGNLKQRVPRRLAGSDVRLAGASRTAGHRRGEARRFPAARRPGQPLHVHGALDHLSSHNSGH